MPAPTLFPSNSLEIASFVEMPFSHHSHSGQFCGHAENSLEEVVQTAIEKKLEVFVLTEHMPREEEDFYSTEVVPFSTSNQA